MNKSILDHINEEKNISKYKLSVLSKGETKKYKERLISIEKEFIKYPFERLDLKSVEEARAAFQSFRQDRKTFYDKYEESAEVVRATRFHIKGLERRVSFYEKVYKQILEENIAQTNIVQNKKLAAAIGASDIVSACGSHGIDTIINAEGAYASKQRARIQILQYCLARFTFDKLNKIKTAITKDIDMDEYLSIKKDLDSFYSDVDRLLYKYYNKGIQEVPLVTNGTLGHNSFLPTVYPLKNISEDCSRKLVAKRLLGRDRSFFGKNGKPIRKRYVERGFGVVTDMSRVGNESLNLFYLDLWSKKGIRLTNLFETSFFNQRASSGYLKAISMLPLWRWPEKVDNPYLEREVFGLLGLDSGSLTSLDFSDKKILNIINASAKRSVEIDASSSKIMVAATRAESSSILSARKFLQHMIEGVKSNYIKAFD